MDSELGLSVDTVLTDVDFVTADLHLNHQNIISYCRDETFATTQSGLDDMNWHLLANWNRRVSPEDTVVFVGDFAWCRHGERDPIIQRKVDNLWDVLNGEKIFVRGDHDHVIPTDAAEDIYAVEIQHQNRVYFVSHFPGDTPDDLPGDGMPGSFEQRLPTDFGSRCDAWRIHGHHHNNWPDIYPLLNPKRKTINCSVELTAYRPLSMTEIDSLVGESEWVDSW